jgi:hypothetical protein
MANSYDRSSEVKAVGIVFIILAWFFVGMRCYVRITMTRLFRIDDWLAVITTVCDPTDCLCLV